ncbi:hypothetical protein BT96DRAFT_978943 [Gymnopus androsaceus JB14]|uniref:Uncharacterized protein n=1 Tax=Gymnopus androsaceus JB14 TaxID=1447944 RepID=A0A6A4H6R6_9AGAR|nr:hypothetical protein BT96DRAFT_978943 [Gymnopus androsaceus JB14]
MYLLMASLLQDQAKEDEIRRLMTEKINVERDLEDVKKERDAAYRDLERVTASYESAIRDTRELEAKLASARADRNSAATNAASLLQEIRKAASRDGSQTREDQTPLTPALSGSLPTSEPNGSHSASTFNNSAQLTIPSTRFALHAGNSELALCPGPSTSGAVHEQVECKLFTEPPRPRAVMSRQLTAASSLSPSPSPGDLGPDKVEMAADTSSRRIRLKRRIPSGFVSNSNGDEDEDETVKVLKKKKIAPKVCSKCGLTIEGCQGSTFKGVAACLNACRDCGSKECNGGEKESVRRKMSATSNAGKCPDFGKL